MTMIDPSDLDDCVHCAAPRMSHEYDDLRCRTGGTRFATAYADLSQMAPEYQLAAWLREHHGVGVPIADLRKVLVGIWADINAAAAPKSAEAPADALLASQPRQRTHGIKPTKDTMELQPCADGSYMLQAQPLPHQYADHTTHRVAFSNWQALVEWLRNEFARADLVRESVDATVQKQAE